MKPLIFKIAAIIALSFAGFGGPDAAAETSVPAKIKAQIETQAKNRLSAEERRNISLAGNFVLKHVNQARFNMTRRETGSVLRDVEQAQKLVRMIQRISPAYTFKARIEAADEVYEEEDEIEPLYVSVFDELTPVGILRPVLAAQGSSVPKYTRVFLDVALAERNLEAARRAAEAEDFPLADAALLGIQEGVLFEYRSRDLPLSRAGRFIMSARELLTEGAVGDSKRALEMAVEALDVYEKDAPGPVADQVRQLKTEISTAVPVLNTGASSGQSDQMTRWWDQITEWYALPG